MNPWKDLLNKIFPGAELHTAPEEYFVPGERPEDPVERIHAMRKIRGSGGFARMYGAKDVEQFIRQAEYMRDFTDDYPKEIPFGDGMPTYADMSLAQLRCYFSWRAKALAGDWNNTSYSYVLLHVFELLNAHDEPERIAERLAECWLEMERWHPKLNAKLPQWLKDYYICHKFKLPFGALVKELGLEECFPEPSQRRGLLALSSYSARDSRFLRERPEYLPVLESALEAAVGNLAPLFNLHGVNEEETFFMKPARFSFHELYKDAAAQAPALTGSREVRVSRSEIYRLKGGGWSRAMEDAFRPPSHAVGYVVKRLERELRRRAGFDAPWSDPEGNSFLERWMQAEPAAVPLTQDPRLPAILAETANAALTPGTPTPVTDTLARELEQEPLRSILALRGISGFVKQGRRLAKLEDDYPDVIEYSGPWPDYGELSHAQLRTYLTWRTKIRAGVVQRADTAYALLYARELEASIGTAQPLESLCRYLRAYAPLDRAVARRLPERIAAIGSRVPDFAALLEKEGVQAFFPDLFLFGACPQLPVFDQLSPYRITKSRFYQPGRAALFDECFDRVLQASMEAFKEANLSLRQAMQGPFGPALAGYLLKRMEQKLRERVNYPYAIAADPLRMVNPPQGRGKLRGLLASGALGRAIDGAVDGFAQENDLSMLAGVKKQAFVKKAAPPLPPTPEPTPEVKVDFALLPRIREEAMAVTEQLIVEEEMRNENAECRNEETLHIGHSCRYKAFNPAQIALIENLCAGNQAGADAMDVEAINEIALEIFGDTLIEGDADGFAVIEEYRDSWRNT